MTSYVTPKKGFPFICYIGLVSQSTGQFQSNPTLAAGDFKISKDGGALGNLATLPAVTPASSKSVKISLDSDETNADNLVIIGSDAAGAEWDDIFINIQTTARQIDDLAFPTTSGRSITVSTSGEVDASLTRVEGQVLTTHAIGAIPSDNRLWLGGTIPAVNTTGIPKIDLVRVDGQATNGNNATLNLKKLNIVNNAGDAFVATSTGSDGHGFIATGNGIGDGIRAQGGSNANGMSAVSGLIDGSGMYITTVTGASALSIISDGGPGATIEGTTIGAEFLADNIGGIAISALNVGGGGKSINAPNDISVSDGNLTLTAIASAVWSNTTRTLTAISDSAGVTTLLSRIASALNISSGKVESNVKQINDTNITGNGSGTPWGPA